MTTPAAAAPGWCAGSHRASAAVAARTTARFIRFGPAAIAPRSPAVPNSSRPPNRSASSAQAASLPSASSPRSSAWSPGSGSSAIHACTWSRRADRLGLAR